MDFWTVGAKFLSATQHLKMKLSLPHLVRMIWHDIRVNWFWFQQNHSISRSTRWSPSSCYLLDCKKKNLTPCLTPDINCCDLFLHDDNWCRSWSWFRPLHQGCACHWSIWIDVCCPYQHVLCNSWFWFAYAYNCWSFSQKLQVLHESLQCSKSRQSKPLWLFLLNQHVKCHDFQLIDEFLLGILLLDSVLELDASVPFWESFLVNINNSICRTLSCL